MKTPVRRILAILAAVTAAASSPATAATVFFDDFEAPDATPLISRIPSVGGIWSGNATGITGGTFDTTGGARNAYATLASVLGTGQALTLTFDTLLTPGNNSFSSGWAGVSLFSGPVESAFAGDTYSGSVWGVDGSIPGSPLLSNDNTVQTSVVFTYVYDSGEWSFSTASGVSMSGAGLPQQAIDRLRIANNQGGDIRVDNLRVDISAVPEPASILLLAPAALALLRRRRA